MRKRKLTILQINDSHGDRKLDPEVFSAESKFSTRRSEAWRALTGCAENERACGPSTAMRKEEIPRPS